MDKVRPLKGKSYRNLMKLKIDQDMIIDMLSIIKRSLNWGWRPKYKWQDGISKTIDWYLDNYNFLESKNKKDIFR